MIKPIVNINGTDPLELLNGYVRAIGALNEALDTVSDITVHGRDYVIDSEAYNQARNEHVIRMQQLIRVRNELQSIAEDIATQPRTIKALEKSNDVD